MSARNVRGRRSRGTHPQGARPRKSSFLKGRGDSSVRWIKRRRKDVYADAAQQEGYRSRAAFKLLEIDDRFTLFARGGRVLDLGSRPGGWSQVAALRVDAPRHGSVTAVDVEEMEPIPGVDFVTFDAEAGGFDDVRRMLAERSFTVVLSDMAPPATGHRSTDVLRVTVLAESALSLADGLLANGGSFCTKVLEGEGVEAFVASLRGRFSDVRRCKPKSSHKESRETYVVARGFVRPRPLLAPGASGSVPPESPREMSLPCEPEQ